MEKYIKESKKGCVYYLSVCCMCNEVKRWSGKEECASEEIAICVKRECLSLNPFMKRCGYQ